MADRKERKSRVLEYLNSREEKAEEPDPFEGLDEAFGLASGKEQSSG